MVVREISGALLVRAMKIRRYRRGLRAIIGAMVCAIGLKLLAWGEE